MMLSDLTGSEAPATITVEEVALLLGIGRKTAYELIANGDIPSLKLGRRTLIPVPKLLEMLGAEPGRNRANEVTVVVPEDLPAMTPKLARLLLRMLLEAAAKEDEE